MKRNCLFFLFAILSILANTSCEKEKTINKEASQADPTENLPNIDGELGFRSDEFDLSECPSLKSSVYKSGDMLVFQDMEHFEKCAICLDNEYETYNDDYEAQYPEATVEELDSLDIVNNFDEWTPFIAFETQLNFNSLRAKVENEIIQWLQLPPESFNFEDDPDDSVPVFEESVRTLLNEDGKAQIGTEILSMGEWEEDAEMVIPDSCGFATKTVRFFDGDDHPSLGDNHRLKVKVKVRSGLVNSRLIGKIVHYKQGNCFGGIFNGGWCRKRAKLKVGVIGPSFDGNCNLMPQVWNKSKGYEKRKSRRVVARIWLLWREAFVAESSPIWPAEACLVNAFYKNDNNYFPVYLVRE